MAAPNAAHEIEPQSVIAALCNFYKDTIETNRIGDTLHLAMPVLMPDGWQTVISLRQDTPKTISLSDNGATTAWLKKQGINLQAPQISHFIKQRLQMYEVELCNKSLFIQKNISAENYASHLQLFAESLSSIAHLFYRQEIHKAPHRVSYESVQNIISSEKLAGVNLDYIFNNLTYPIRVDFAIPLSKGMQAFKTIDKKSHPSARFEVDMYRLMNLAREEENVQTALVYNEHSEIDSDLKNYAKGQLDLVCTHAERPLIRQFIREGQTA